MPPLGIGLIVVSGVVTSCVLGVVYSFACFYITFIYIRFFLTFGLGWVIGKAVVWAAKTGKVRNTHLLGIYGLAFGLLGSTRPGRRPLARGGLLARGGFNWIPLGVSARCSDRIRQDLL